MDEVEASALHLYFCFFEQRGPWFPIDDLYGTYYAAARGEDPINRNDLIASLMYPNANERWRHYKAFFDIQYPRKATPDQTRKPNFKVEPCLKHINAISQEAWILGPEASVDEQTIGFQVNHICKLRIIYKSEGDGFQCDALCQDGFTYSFFFATILLPEST